MAWLCVGFRVLVDFVVDDESLLSVRNLRVLDREMKDFSSPARTRITPLSRSWTQGKVTNNEIVVKQKHVFVTIALNNTIFIVLEQRFSETI